MEKKEKIFAKGFYAKRNEKAPEFVVCNLQINIEKGAGDFIKEHLKDGKINFQICKNKGGELYVELDTFVPIKREATNQMPF
jgi:hypothetical protein